MYKVGLCLGYDINCRTDCRRAVKVLLALVAEGDNTVYEGEDGVVLAEANVMARHHAGAALAHDNIARLGYLAGIELDAKVFCLRVCEVFSCAARFFTCHTLYLLCSI